MKHGFDVSQAARSESLLFIHCVRKCSRSACYGRAELPDEMYPDEVCGKSYPGSLHQELMPVVILSRIKISQSRVGIDRDERVTLLFVCAASGFVHKFASVLGARNRPVCVAKTSSETQRRKSWAGQKG